MRVYCVSVRVYVYVFLYVCMYAICMYACVCVCVCVCVYVCMCVSDAEFQSRFNIPLIGEFCKYAPPHLQTAIPSQILMHTCTCTYLPQHSALSPTVLLVMIHSFNPSPLPKPPLSYFLVSLRRCDGGCGGSAECFRKVRGCGVCVAAGAENYASCFCEYALACVQYLYQIYSGLWYLYQIYSGLWYVHQIYSGLWYVHQIYSGPGILSDICSKFTMFSDIFAGLGEI